MTQSTQKLQHVHFNASSRRLRGVYQEPIHVRYQQLHRETVPYQFQGRYQFSLDGIQRFGSDFEEHSLQQNVDPGVKFVFVEPDDLVEGVEEDAEALGVRVHKHFREDLRQVFQFAGCQANFVAEIILKREETVFSFLPVGAGAQGDYLVDVLREQWSKIRFCLLKEFRDKL